MNDIAKIVVVGVSTGVVIGAAVTGATMALKKKLDANSAEAIAAALKTKIKL